MRGDVRLPNYHYDYHRLPIGTRRTSVRGVTRFPDRGRMWFRTVRTGVERKNTSQAVFVSLHRTCTMRNQNSVMNSCHHMHWNTAFATRLGDLIHCNLR